MKTNQQFIATCPLYCEDLLKTEIEGFGGKNINTHHGAVHFEGNLLTAYGTCLWSRIANTVLYPLAGFDAASRDELYEKLLNIPFFEHFSVEKTFAIRSHVSDTFFSNPNIANLVVKDAIADSFRNRMNKRPSVDPTRPDIRLTFYMKSEKATISLELSSESMYRRAYRTQGVEAPLKENVAAAVLLRAEWEQISRHQGVLVDLMCGSGTFAIEALFIAADIAPGLLRKSARMKNWNGHDTELWDSLVKEAEQRREAGLSKKLSKIIAFDNDPEAVDAAYQNTLAAKVEKYIQIVPKDFRDAIAPKSEAKPKGLVVANPPYGERLGDKSTVGYIYQDIGRTLFDKYQNYNAAILTGDKELARKVGLRANRLNTLYNGNIRCTLAHFNIREENEFRMSGKNIQ
ncbi:MAG: hypothetical protein JW904_07160 [Spirochaetales bacterium]|nr:hypothetical protein [Spirochaetales bacterium]